MRTIKTIEVVQSKHGWKIINRSSIQHPLLRVLASILKESNKTNPIKCGIYNIFGSEFSHKISVYSYIAGKTERMTKQQYYKFLKGERSVKSKDSLDNMVKRSANIDLGIDKIMEAING